MVRLTPKRWAIVFFCSLALNVFLIGVIATAWLSRDRDRAARMTTYTVPWAYRVLGREVGADARRIYLKYQAQMSTERQALLKDYTEINRILSTEPFDRQTFLAALDDLRGDTVAAQRTMHEAMADFAADLTAAQRSELAAFAEAWAERRERRALRREERIERRQREDDAAR